MVPARASSCEFPTVQTDSTRFAPARHWMSVMANNCTPLTLWRIGSSAADGKWACIVCFGASSTNPIVARTRGAHSDPPAAGPLGKGIDHKGDLGKAGQSMGAGRVDDPERIGSLHLQGPVDSVHRTRGFAIADGGYGIRSAPDPCQPHRAHQAFNCVFGRLTPRAPQFAPGLAGSLKPKAGCRGTSDVVADHIFVSGSRRPLVRIGKSHIL